MSVEISDEMRRKGRNPDPVFLSEEDLYIRFNSVVGGKVSMSSIRCGDQSVNRSKYSRPEWVLLARYPKYINWGFGSFKVGEIPEVVTLPAAKPVEFRIVHEPEEENYSHSVIYRWKSGGPHRKVGNRNIRNKFRAQLSQRIQIMKVPDEQ